MTKLKPLFDAEDVALKTIFKAREKVTLLEDISEEKSRLKTEMGEKASKDSEKLFTKLVSKKVREIQKEIKTEKEKLDKTFSVAEKNIPKISKELVEDLVKNYE